MDMQYIRIKAFDVAYIPVIEQVLVEEVYGWGRIEIGCLQKFALIVVFVFIGQSRIDIEADIPEEDLSEGSEQVSGVLFAGIGHQLTEFTHTCCYSDASYFVVGEVCNQIFVVFKIGDNNRLPQRAQQFGSVQKVLFIGHTIFAQVIECNF